MYIYFWDISASHHKLVYIPKEKSAQSPLVRETLVEMLNVYHAKECYFTLKASYSLEWTFTFFPPLGSLE